MGEAGQAVGRTVQSIQNLAFSIFTQDIIAYYPTADAAARAAHNSVHSLSVAKDREYVIYFNYSKKLDMWSCGDGIEKGQHSSWSNPFIGDAVYHHHGAYSGNDLIYSGNDKVALWGRLLLGNGPIYMGAYDNSLWRLDNPSGTQVPIY